MAAAPSFHDRVLAQLTRTLTGLAKGPTAAPPALVTRLTHLAFPSEGAPLSTKNTAIILALTACLPTATAENHGVVLDRLLQILAALPTAGWRLREHEVKVFTTQFLCGLASLDLDKASLDRVIPVVSAVFTEAATSFLDTGVVDGSGSLGVFLGLCDALRTIRAYWQEETFQMALKLCAQLSQAGRSSRPDVDVAIARMLAFGVRQKHNFPRGEVYACADGLLRSILDQEIDPSKDEFREHLSQRTAILELMVASADEDTAAEVLEELQAQQRLKNFDILKSDLYVATLRGTAFIADHFDALRNRGIEMLRNFLYMPSPLMSRLWELKDSKDTFKGEREQAAASIQLMRDACVQGIILILKKQMQESNDHISRHLQSVATKLVLRSSGEADPVSLNAITSLSETAVALQEIEPESVGLAVDMMNQRLARPPSSLDGPILHELSSLAVQSPTVALTPVMGILMQIAYITLQDGNQSAREKYTHVVSERDGVETNAAVAALGVIAKDLAPIHLQKSFFRTLLDRYTTLAEGTHATKCLADLKDYATRLACLVPVLGESARTLHAAGEQPLVEALAAFRSFWMFVAITSAGKPPPKELAQAYKAIALMSPPLVDEQASRFLQKEIEAVASVFAGNVTAKDLVALKQTFSSCLLPSDQYGASGAVNLLDFSDLAYLLSISVLETHRISNSEADVMAFFKLFDYIADKGIMSTQSQLMLTIANKLFDSTLSLQRLTDRRDTAYNKRMEDLMVVLLTMFNHRTKAVKEAADQFLPRLIKRFPHLTWSGTVLRNMLHLLDVLHAANDEDPAVIGTARMIEIPHAPHELLLSDIKDDRESMEQFYSLKCAEILQQAFTFAAKETAGNVREFVTRLKPGEGVASLHVISQLGTPGAPGRRVKDSTSLFFGPDLGLHSHHKTKVEVMASLLSKADFEGWTASLSGLLYHLAAAVREKSGLHAEMKGISVPASLLLSQERPEEGALQLSFDEAQELLGRALLDATAVMLQTGANPVLMHAIAWCPVEAFTGTAMEAGITCWNWIHAAQPELEHNLLCQLQNAWAYTVDSQLGLFSGEHGAAMGIEHVDFEQDRDKPDPAPHALWLKYLTNRFEVSRNRHAETLACFVGIVHKSLRHSLCKHITMVLPRYRLFHLSMRILQSDAQLDKIHQTLMRERLYFTLLRVFAEPSKLPTTTDLDEEIEATIAVWKCLAKDQAACVKIDTQKDVHSAMTAEGKARGSSKFALARKLALVLVRYDMDLLATWRNPTMQASRMIKDEDVVRSTKKPKDSRWRDFARLAWAVDPHLAIQLAYRFRSSDALWKQVTKLVQKTPAPVSDLPEAIHFLVTPQVVESQPQELYQVLFWAPVAPITALNFLRQYPGNPIISQYAIGVLKSFSPQTILFSIPQLVQVLRYDNRGYVAQYMLDACNESQLLAHQMIWNMRTNAYTDDEGEEKDEQLGDTLERLSDAIIDGFEGPGKAFYEREFDFFSQITGVSGKIRDKPLGPERRKACLEELSKIELQNGCYLPSNPEAVVLEIDYSSGRPMQSAAKAPYLATFRVKETPTLRALEAYDPGNEDTHSIIQDDDTAHKQSAIFKVGDDVRQDMLALQIIELCKQIYESIELDVYLVPYRVVATAPGCGVIQCVPDASSRQQLGEQTADSLDRIFLQRYGDEDSLEFQQARNNFIKSMAAYSVVTFLLQIKDRHNGNIMINTTGHIIHIDFGFLFESSPGGNIGFEPDFKLTQEMVDIMGGDQNSPSFRLFRELCARAYLAVRPYHEQVVSLVSLMLNSGLPCFRTKKVLDALRARFQPGRSIPEASQYMMQRVDTNYLNFRTKGYDLIQYYQNQIPY